MPYPTVAVVEYHMNPGDTALVAVFSDEDRARAAIAKRRPPDPDNWSVRSVRLNDDSEFKWY